MLLLSLINFAPYGFGQEVKNINETPTQKNWFDKKVESLQVRSGYFGIQLVQEADFQRRAMPQEIRKLEVDQIDQGLLQQTQRLSTLTLPSISIPEGPALPSLEKLERLSNLQIQQIQRLIQTDAMKAHLHQQLQQLRGQLAQNLPVFQSLHEAVDTHLTSWVDFEIMAEKIWALSQSHSWNHLTFESLADLSLQNIPWQTFYDQAALQEVLSNIQASVEDLHQESLVALKAFQHNVETTLAQTIVQSQFSLTQQGYTFNDSTIFFQDPEQNKDSFAFDTGYKESQFEADGQTSDQQAAGSFNTTIGDYIHIQGSMQVNVDGLVQEGQSQAEAIAEDLFTLLEQAIAQPTSMTSFLDDLESYFQNIPTLEKENLLAILYDNIDTDFSLTLHMKNMADRFEGTGIYEYIDVILETLGHDVGQVTFSKNQILDLVEMWTTNASQSNLTQYVLNDVIGVKTDVVTYSVARDLVNGYLSSHFQGKMIALQHGLTSGGGMIFQNQAIFGAATLHAGDKTRWMLTGSYNQPYAHQAPLLKEDGYLQAHASLLSHSVGIAYIPKLWRSPNQNTQLNGLVQIEALFIQPQYVKIVSQAPNQSQRLYELYNVPLDDFDQARDTYTVPMLSTGLNLQHRVSPAMTISGYAIAYPGLQNQGNIEKLKKAVTAKFQSGFSLILHLQAQ
jgi:hypothetical protein